MSLAVKVQKGAEHVEVVVDDVAQGAARRSPELRFSSASVRLKVNRRDQLRILRTLNKALESKDYETKGHSRRVVRHVTRMARAMGLPADEMTDLRLAAAFHDIGKISVPNDVIRKPGTLDAEETALMQEHASMGAWMLADIGSPGVIEAVRSHHERWDGKGYPNRLSGERIPRLARIIAVADTFDAITSTRPYRTAAGSERGLEVIREEAGRQFDPHCVEAFLVSFVGTRALSSSLLFTERFRLGPGVTT